MKLILLSNTVDPTNGYGNMTYELVSHLARLHQVTLLLPRHPSPPRLPRVYILPILPRHIFSIKQIHAWDFLTWKPPHLQADLIHSLFAFPYAILAHRLATRNHLPLIIGAQGTYGVLPLTHQPEKFFLTRAYNSASHLHCPSAYTANQIKTHTHLTSPISTIPNAISTKEFSPIPNLARLKKQYPHGPILLGIGALKKRKGFDVAIRAVAQLVPDLPQLKYIIIGQGEQKKHLQQLISSLHLEKHVFLLGHLSRQELIRYLHFCNLYLHTPRSHNHHFEGFGLVYLEAAACGKPVIASRSGGVPSAVKHGQTGLLAQENSPASTARALTKLLNDTKLYSRLSTNSIAWAKQHDWSIISRKFQSLYLSITQSR